MVQSGARVAKPPCLAAAGTGHGYACRCDHSPEPRLSNSGLAVFLTMPARIREQHIHHRPAQLQRFIRCLPMPSSDARGKEEFTGHHPAIRHHLEDCH
jgi:hypothetical protein